MNDGESKNDGECRRMNEKNKRMNDRKSSNDRNQDKSEYRRICFDTKVYGYPTASFSHQRVFWLTSG